MSELSKWLKVLKQKHIPRLNKILFHVNLFSTMYDAQKLLLVEKSNRNYTFYLQKSESKPPTPPFPTRGLLKSGVNVIGKSEPGGSLLAVDEYYLPESLLSLTSRGGATCGGRLMRVRVAAGHVSVAVFTVCGLD